MKTKITFLALISAVLLAACSATPASSTATPQPVATAVAPAAEPTAAPTNTAAAPAPEPTAAPADTAAAPAPEPTAAPTDTAAAPTPEPTVAPTEAPQVAAVTKIDLNTGTAEQFLTVPNVGNRMVREFQEYRPYASIEQFRREIGKYVDAAQVADYEKYVFVPIAPNDADAATLQQLPGVDAGIAGQLIAARPYATRDAFVAKLTELVGAGQSAAGQTMVTE